MTYKGHLALGYAFSLSPLLLFDVRNYVLNSFSPFVLVCSFIAIYFFSLFPDLDEPKAYLSKRFPWNFISILLSFFVDHRGITHTLIFSFVFPAILAIILYSFNLLDKYWICVVVAWMAYISHLIGDSLTKSGVKWLYPFSNKNFHLLPKKLTFRTGSFVETIFTFLFFLLFGYEMYLFYTPFSHSNLHHYFHLFL